MKKIFSLVLVALILVTSLAGCGKKEAANINALDRVKQAGKISFGLDDSFPPMEFRDENNNLVGFDIDFGNAIAKKLGVKAEFVTTDFNGILLSLTSGKFDAILATLSITDERKKSIDFSEPYIMEGIIAIVKNGNSSVTKLEDLSGKVVACQMGSTSDAAAQKINGIKELKKYDKITEALHDLLIGRVDAVVVDELVGRYYTSQKTSDYKVLDKKLNDEPVGIGFKKQDKELNAAVQQAINDLKADGTLSSISKKWFGVDIYSK